MAKELSTGSGLYYDLCVYDSELVISHSIFIDMPGYVEMQLILSDVLENIKEIFLVSYCYNLLRTV